MASYTFTAHLQPSGNNLWGAHLPVPDEIAQIFVGEGDKRVVCSLNEQQPFQCGLIPNGNKSYVIVLNKKWRETLRLEPGMAVRVSLEKDDSKYGLPMPEEMEAVLAQDEAGDRLFHALTPGKIRTLLYIAGNVKNSDGRIKRALAIVEHLKMNGGKIDFKALGEELK